ncbi:HAD family hydrolase [Streptomyces marianii]|uniref:HAD family hydrolase n=1 Tax=Streptomyces marianii TaxID=1817406 RepID=A0A5R9E3L8_9ACTN|nr:HAD family hydrolase [Streptomyces marianii]TLQ44530.1 HAD family hydrolase [Streptomyces marianii]
MILPAPFVLFDLDGTLIRPGSGLQRRHMAAMQWAIRETSGSAEEFRYEGGDLFYAYVNLSGFTDAGTIEAALTIAGTPRAALPAARERAVTLMRHRLGTEPHPHSADDALPGAVHAVRALAAAGVRVGLSTGNARSIALWKVERLGLADVLTTGGFGDVARDRDLVVAQGLAAFGGNPTGGVVVGDTAKDISAAHNSGLRCVAVATGGSTEEQLARAGADKVLRTLDHPHATTVITEVARGPAVCLWGKPLADGLTGADRVSRQSLLAVSPGRPSPAESVSSGAYSVARGSGPA